MSLDDWNQERLPHRILTEKECKQKKSQAIARIIDMLEFCNYGDAVLFQVLKLLDEKIILPLEPEEYGGIESELIRLVPSPENRSQILYQLQPLLWSPPPSFTIKTLKTFCMPHFREKAMLDAFFGTLSTGIKEPGSLNLGFYNHIVSELNRDNIPLLAQNEILMFLRSQMSDTEIEQLEAQTLSAVESL